MANYDNNYSQEYVRKHSVWWGIRWGDCILCETKKPSENL